MSESKRTRIPFHFSPRMQDGSCAVEKAEGPNGAKRRYLQGVASGLKTDKHEERMTPRCIKSFMDQATSGQVLLYPDVHNVRATDDIGILVKAEIQPNGDWWTEYRLYDDMDDVDDRSKQIANKIWKQMNGLPPYKKAMQKGFSIEGYIPDGGLQSYEEDADGNVIKRVIDNIVLDGVVVVPRPAYSSMASAVAKALGEMTPMHEARAKDKARNVFKDVLNGQEVSNQYYKRRWDINDALEKAVEITMKSSRPLEQKRQELVLVFKEYANSIIPLITKSESLFQGKQDDPIVEPMKVKKGKTSRADVYKALIVELGKLKNKLNGGNP